MNILIINRWDDEFSRYENYLDHDTHGVAYITTVRGLRFLPADSAKSISVVKDIENLELLCQAFKEAVAKVGKIDRVIALSEFDLLNAAKLRVLFSVPGPNVDEVSKFRNKVLMKESVAKAGLRTPAFISASFPGQVLSFSKEVGYPIVMKPKLGAASVGVFIIKNRWEMDVALASAKLDEVEFEQYIEGDIYHVDGIVDSKGLAFYKVSKYVGTCLEFASGAVLGSYTIAPSEIHSRISEFSSGCLDALSLMASAFHLEVIVQGENVYFLEMGARVGGGEIPFTMLEVHGVDLYREWITLIIEGGESAIRGFSELPKYSGFVLFPEPVGKQFVGVKNAFESVTVYNSDLADAGYVFDGAGGYEKLPARFKFSSFSCDELRAEIERCIQQFTYEVNDLESITGTPMLS